MAERLTVATDSCYDYAIVGGGIVGLSTAYALSRRFPSASLVLLEKEGQWGRHQTGHNSGVVHSGVYYRPGSLKASLTVQGNREMITFCRDHSIPHAVRGKVIVALDESEMPGLDRLLANGTANGIQVSRLGPEKLSELEPHARGIAALHVPSAGVVDYGSVSTVLAGLLSENGVDLKLSQEVRAITHLDSGRVHLETTGEALQTRYLVCCAGLQSDRLARLAGLQVETRIVPFRGQYFNIGRPSADLVHSLIYPVPDPRFPFLGVHLTRGFDDHVHAGPNALLALKREGYGPLDFSVRDAADALTYPGFWRLLSRSGLSGPKEVARTASSAAFARSVRSLVPEVDPGDLSRGANGIRAQALTREGRLVDDFLFTEGPNSLHVLNAPSPAATAAFPIGRAIVDRIVQATG